MNNKEMLISIFKKEIGTLRSEHERDYGDCQIHGLEFLHKSKITVKIILIEMEDNQWIVHHELSKENPFLQKKIVRVCERIQRIKEDKNSTLLLSEDLLDIKKETFIKTAIRSLLQNCLSNQTLFSLGDNRSKSYSHKKIHTEVINEKNTI